MKKTSNMLSIFFNAAGGLFNREGFFFSQQPLRIHNSSARSGDLWEFSHSSWYLNWSWHFQLSFCWQPHCCDFTGTPSLSYRRHLAANILVLRLFQSLCALFWGVPWALDVVGVVQTQELGLHKLQLVVLSILTSCGSLFLFLCFDQTLCPKTT